MRRYRYRDDLTRADAAFEVEGANLEEVFEGAADALLRLMVEDAGALLPRVRKQVHLKRQTGEDGQGLAELLHDFLEQILFWKDAEQLLLRVEKLRVRAVGSGRWFELWAELVGDQIDPQRQRLGVDVKAVTFHGLRVWSEGAGWRAVVVVDV